MAKQIRINELKKLVRSTINEIKSESIRMHESKSMSKRERRGITDRLIAETVKAVLMEAEVEGEDAIMDGSFDADDKKNHPYDRFLANLFGSNFTDENATIDLTNAKTVIRDFVKKMVDEDDAGAGNTYGQLVTGGDGSSEDTIIDLQEDKSMSVSELKPSQLEVFLPQSIDGYLTRGEGFTKDIMAGSYDSGNSIFMSKDGYIIDGHHRVSSMYGLNPGASVKGVVMTAPIETCLKLLNLILEAYEGGSAKVASGKPENSIWNKTPTMESVKETLMATSQRTGKYPPLAKWSSAENDDDPAKALQAFVDDMDKIGHPSKGDVDAFCQSVADNYSAWSAPESKFGNRDQMPQLEDDWTDDSNVPESERTLAYADFIKPGLEKGEFDYGRPHNYNESVDLRRWNKLAGILKD